MELDHNKKFIYIEDNGDGTCIITISIPEEEIFKSALLTFNMEDIFPMTMEQMSPEFLQLIDDQSIDIPNAPPEEE